MNDKVIAKRKKVWKKGDRIELISMDDVQAPPAGTTGTVIGVDDMGQIMVNWDNGSTLSVIPEAGDSIRRIPNMSFPIKAQFNVCSNYQSCFARKMTINEIGPNSHCLECDLYRSYNLGFSAGVKQTVDAVNNVEPLLTRPSLREKEL